MNIHFTPEQMALRDELRAYFAQLMTPELGEHIDDDFLEAFTTRGAPEEIAGKLLAKYGQHADRLAIYAPYAAPDGMWKKIVEGLKRER